MADARLSTNQLRKPQDQIPAAASQPATIKSMQDYTLDLAILAAFVALCAVDIGTGHSAVAGLIVTGIGLMVIVVFILVLRFGFGQTTAPTTSVIRDHSVTHANRQRG